MREDYYYHQAKSKGYRSRAAYKLFQIDSKFHLFKKGNIIIDLGASPGGWSQAASKLVGVGGKVIAIDKAYISPFKEKNIEILNKDIMNRKLVLYLTETYGKVDGLVSDCSPNISGDFSRDHSVQISLAYRALNIASELLVKQGFFVSKLFQGAELQEFIDEMKKFFDKTKLFKPKASRKKSAEIYVIGLNYVSPADENSVIQ